VVVVLAAQDIYVQRAPGCHGEGIKYVREHLRREIADLFALDTQVSYAIGTRANVDNCARKSLSSVVRACEDLRSGKNNAETCLVERSKARTVSTNPFDFT
jgi:hypothetical protein